MDCTSVVWQELAKGTFSSPMSCKQAISTKLLQGYDNVCIDGRCFDGPVVAGASYDELLILVLHTTGLMHKRHFRLAVAVMPKPSHRCVCTADLADSDRHTLSCHSTVACKPYAAMQAGDQKPQSVMFNSQSSCCSQADGKAGCQASRFMHLLLAEVLKASAVREV